MSAIPPTAIPPTAIPPTAIPPTAIPPTAAPPTAAPPTAATHAAASAELEQGEQLLERLFPPGTVRRMDWGSGERPLPGWLAVDLKDGDAIHLTNDIREGLPLPDGCLDQIASIHALPMISYPDLVPVLVELRRVLRPGGVLRLCLPDLDRAIAAYQRGDRSYFLVPDEDESTLSGKLIVQLMWYGWSVTMFTEEFIESLLRRAGFSQVLHCSMGQSPTGSEGICELDNRPEESLFVEAVR